MPKPPSEPALESESYPSVTTSRLRVAFDESVRSSSKSSSPAAGAPAAREPEPEVPAVSGANLTRFPPASASCGAADLGASERASASQHCSSSDRTGGLVLTPGLLCTSLGVV